MFLCLQVINEGNSRENRKEGDMALALANYLMQQGFTPDDITILAAYSGQMFYMRKVWLLTSLLIAITFTTGFL